MRAIRPAASSPGRCCSSAACHDDAAALHVLDLAEGRLGRPRLRSAPGPGTSRRFDNYVKVLSDGRFLRWFATRLIIATSSPCPAVFFDSLVGYTLAKFRFRGRYIVFLAILSTLMIPTEMLVIPWYVMAKQARLARQLLGHHVPGMMTAFGTFLMKQFFETVPNDFLEAARIDGLNEFAIWWKVAMPLVTPALSALAIFTFLGNWTAFFWPLIVTTEPELYTLPVGLSSFAVEQSIQWELIMTGAALATLPTLIDLPVLPALHRARRHARRSQGLIHDCTAGLNDTSVFPDPVYQARRC
jgi:multiple sugar transport system permease protein